MWNEITYTLFYNHSTFETVYDSGAEDLNKTANKMSNIPPSPQVQTCCRLLTCAGVLGQIRHDFIQTYVELRLKLFKNQ